MILRRSAEEAVRANGRRRASQPMTTPARSETPTRFGGCDDAPTWNISHPSFDMASCYGSCYGVGDSV